MVSPAVMASTPTSAVGNKHLDQGFTLIEMLVVIAIVAVATIGVQLSLQRAQDGLQRESEQLSAWIEVVRADARANGQTVHLQFNAQGVTANSTGLHDRVHPWASPNTRAQVVSAGLPSNLDLPPEPVVGAFTIDVSQGTQTQRLHSDGLSALEPVTIPKRP